MLNILRDATVIGVASLASAATLQGLYKVTNFYPPAPVFWFFTGFGAYLGLEALEHLLGKELLLEAAGSSGHTLT